MARKFKVREYRVNCCLLKIYFYVFMYHATVKLPFHCLLYIVGDELCPNVIFG